MTETPEPPKELDAIADVILAYRPKPKSKPAKKRKRRATKIAKAVRPDYVQPVRLAPALDLRSLIGV